MPSNNDKPEPVRLVVPLRPDVFKELQAARKLLNFDGASRLASEILRVWLNNDFGCSLPPDESDSLGRSDDKVWPRSIPIDQQRNFGAFLKRTLRRPIPADQVVRGKPQQAQRIDTPADLGRVLGVPADDDEPSAVRCAFCGAPTVDNDRWNLTGLCPACKLCNVCNNVVVTDDTAMPCGRCTNCATDATCAGCSTQGTCPVFEDRPQAEGG